MKGHSRSSRLLKWIAILQLVRWRVVLLTLVVQYLSAYFVFAAPVTAEQLFLNFRLHLIVLCTSLIISAGFIINSFYDLERDAINHPTRLQLQGLLTKDFALRFYVLLNAAAVLLAGITGWKVFLFMCGFAGALWFYSHKLQKKPVIREISASLLSVISLVSVGLHYAHYSNLLLLYGFYFMMLLFMREGIKDLVAQKGNVIYGYTTMAVALGERKLLQLLMFVYSASLIPVLILCWHHQLLIFHILLIATACLNLLAILWEFFENDRLRFVHAHALMRFVILLALATLFFLYQG
jgi:4-hydroxybenzoate polyprenyltransferase